MCNVCCANDALTPGGFTSAWEKAPKKITLEAWSKGPEFEPYVASITREGDDSIWVKGTDLAGLASRLGLEIKWKYAKKKGIYLKGAQGDAQIDTDVTSAGFGQSTAHQDVVTDKASK
jgi:hypothetical protein